MALFLFSTFSYSFTFNLSKEHYFRYVSRTRYNSKVTLESEVTRYKLENIFIALAPHGQINSFH